MVTAEKTLLSEYLDQGYTVVRGLIDPEEDLRPVLDEYNEVLDGVMKRLFDEGRVSSAFSNLPFGDRISKLISETGTAYIRYCKLCDLEVERIEK